MRSLALHRLSRNLPDFAWKLRRALLPGSVHPGRLLRRLNRAGGPKPAMDPELKRELARELRPEVDRLCLLLGRDLESWRSVTAG